jgi:hypothetical protein
MMLPFRRRPPSQKPSPNDATTKTPEAPSDSVETSPRHLDYDLQPLTVESLSHYIEPVVDDERFRVH